MLVSISPAVAADDASARPTVEEILNEYHEKAFVTQITDEACITTTYSPRSGSVTKTLEQETIDILTAAGYEAYNITPSNYHSLEDKLNTSFQGMGLDPEGSYIIVLHGDDSDTSSAANGIGSRAIVPAPDPGSSTFTYTYNGTTYTMRYVTVTATSGSYMLASSTYTLDPNYWDEAGIMDVFGTYLFYAADSLSEKIPIGTIASLLFDWMQDDNYTALDPGTLTLHAATTWTCDTIQILNNASSQWRTVQASAYAVSHARCVGYVYNPDINDSVWHDGTELSNRCFSPKYTNYSQRKLDAVTAYRNGTRSYDLTGDICFYFGNVGGNLYGNINDPLFTHYEQWEIA